VDRSEATLDVAVLQNHASFDIAATLHEAASRVVSLPGQDESRLHLYINLHLCSWAGRHGG